MNNDGGERVVVLLCTHIQHSKLTGHFCFHLPDPNNTVKMAYASLECKIHAPLSLPWRFRYTSLKRIHGPSEDVAWLMQNWASAEPKRLLFFFLINLFIYFWLCWVFVSVRGLSVVAASGGHSSSWCAGLSLSRPLLLRSTGSRRAGSVVVAHGPSCSAACGIFPDQGSNPCPLHWQADSQPLRHQGSPKKTWNVISMY